MGSGQGAGGAGGGHPFPSLRWPCPGRGDSRVLADSHQDKTQDVADSPRARAPRSPCTDVSGAACAPRGSGAPRPLQGARTAPIPLSGPADPGRPKSAPPEGGPGGREAPSQPVRAGGGGGAREQGGVRPRAPPPRHRTRPSDQKPRAAGPTLWPRRFLPVQGHPLPAPRSAGRAPGGTAGLGRTHAPGTRVSRSRRLWPAHARAQLRRAASEARVPLGPGHQWTLSAALTEGTQRTATPCGGDSGAWALRAELVPQISTWGRPDPCCSESGCSGKGVFTGVATSGGGPEGALTRRPRAERPREDRGAGASV